MIHALTHRLQDDLYFCLSHRVREINLITSQLVHVTTLSPSSGLAHVTTLSPSSRLAHVTTLSPCSLCPYPSSTRCNVPGLMSPGTYGSVLNLLIFHSLPSSLLVFAPKAKTKKFMRKEFLPLTFTRQNFPDKSLFHVFC